MILLLILSLAGCQPDAQPTSENGVPASTPPVSKPPASKPPASKPPASKPPASKPSTRSEKSVEPPGEPTKAARTPEPTFDLQQPKLHRITVVDKTPPALQAHRWDPSLDTRLKRAFLAPGRFVHTDDVTGCEAVLNVYYAFLRNGRAVTSTTEGRAQAGIEAMVHCLVGSATETFRVEESGFKHFAPGDSPSPAAMLEGLVEAVSARAAQTLSGQCAVRHAGDAVVVKLLAQDDDVGRLMEAAIEAGERGLESTLPDLVSLTNHPHGILRMRAAAALGLLKARQPAAIKALVRLTRGADLEQHLVAVGALADIGGPEARRYLENIAQSHPDESIRRLAKQGLSQAKDEGGVP